MNTEKKICQNCKQGFIIEPEDFDFYKKIDVPPPTWCPQCRMLRRFSWRNERKIFRRPESKNGKEVFSGYPAAAQVTVYEHDYWWSDAWDPMEYGREYDFSRPFFEQLDELMRTVPLSARAVVNAVNSEYSNHGDDLKNAYLCFNVSEIEDAGYIVGGTCVKEGFDLYQSRHSELCYDSYMVDESNKIFFSINCEDSHDLWYCRNMIGCTNCFGSMNQRNKSYYLFNEPVGKEKYQQFMKEFSSGSFKSVSEMRARAEELWEKQPNRFTLAINTVNSSGEHIEHTKNVKDSYFIHEAEDLRYCQFLQEARDCHDYSSWGGNADQVYESCEVGTGTNRVRFSLLCYKECRDLEYSALCVSSSDLFGCVGLRKKQYCIFNKQYTKEEYHALRKKIIEHMNEMPYADKLGRVYTYGEFLPSEFSPFAYNETIAQDFFPLTKQEAQKKGYIWREPETREFTTTLKASELPDDIKDVSDDVTKEIIECINCRKAYRIIPLELQFYRRIPLPLPRLCPECRFMRRFSFVNPPQFWPETCHCAGAADKTGVYRNGASHSHGSTHCANTFETSYPPERRGIVYCEKCYQQEVV